MSLIAADVAIGYPGRAPLASGLSLSVEPGERLALLAPSGFGKSTLCRVLSGFMAPMRGEVRADGLRIPEPGCRAVQQLWQHPEQAFDPRLRMRRSLAEAGGLEGDRWDLLSERFGLSAAWLSRFPAELSGGELMRCCIVRALMVSPRYLIADEATAMLDAVTQAQLVRALIDTQEEEGMGMIFVSHSPSLVRRVATRSIDLQQFASDPSLAKLKRGSNAPLSTWAIHKVHTK